MKVVFSILFVLFLFIISSAQAISKEDEGRSIIQSSDRAHELNGNLDGGGLSVTTRKGGHGGGGHGSGHGGGFGRGGKGGGGFGGGGGKGGGGRKGGGGFGKGVVGGAAGGIIGGYIGGTIANGGNNGGYNGAQNSATTLSAVPQFCVSTLILCMSFWL